MHENNRIEQTFSNLFVRAQSVYKMSSNVSDHNLINNYLFNKLFSN